MDTGDLRKGTTVEIDGELYQVLDFQHIKLGRGSAQVRLKLKDIRAGHITERSVQAGTKFSRARVERQPAQYLYADDDLHHFMNTETYDQIALNTERLGDALQYLSENATCQLLTYGDEAIGIELPAAVELEARHIDGEASGQGSDPAYVGVLAAGVAVAEEAVIDDGRVEICLIHHRANDGLGQHLGVHIP